MTKGELKERIRREALAVGFDDAGFARAGFLQKESEHLDEWLKRNCEAGMGYMKRNTDKRTDPSILFPECRTVLVVLLNYRKENHQSVISEYGSGRDYHAIFKEKLSKLNVTIASLAGDAYQSRLFADSSPVMDKAWAVRAGLGLQGRHTLVMHPELGTKFYIGGLLLSLDLEPDTVAELQNPCMSCRICMDACPTGAIELPGYLNASKCIAYQTIEKRDEVSDDVKGHIVQSIFGCDICQNVCPSNEGKNRFASGDLLPGPHSKISLNEWCEMLDEQFDEVCRDTTLYRTGLQKLKATAALAVQNRSIL